MVEIVEVPTAQEFLEATKEIRYENIEANHLITMAASFGKKRFFLLSNKMCSSFAVLSSDGPWLAPNMSLRMAFEFGEYIARDFSGVIQVNGFEPITKEFVDGFQSIDKDSAWSSEGDAGQMYRLEQLKAPTLSIGELIAATLEDFDLLVDWMIAFKFDCYGWKMPRKAACTAVKSPLEQNRTFLWVVNGEPVGFGVHSSPVTIQDTTLYMLGPIYITQPARRKGFAKALTVALVQTVTLQCPTPNQSIILISGVNNVASNQTYRSIGFTPVGILKCYSRVLE
ncbi:hypothetical protein THRCLA_10002 [Thraustotheca clavata]|uniref:N-acetyltransferase domain-containing protein n=1 Tax=Thraustotheca clavata TaxID=74557 RepID=A0A1V9YT99_9STRA|nr:hypothetical protein THRCLA_10002 [Thraustotheca clavata]